MTVHYVDTSALVRAYFADEPDHAHFRALLLEGGDPVVSSELARVELASAVSSAARSGRLRRPTVVLDPFDVDCGDDGPLALLRLDPLKALPLAYTLVQENRLCTLDAIHLAVALTDATGLAGDEPVRFVTTDLDQAAAARSIGKLQV